MLFLFCLLMMLLAAVLVVKIFDGQPDRKAVKLGDRRTRGNLRA